VRPETTRLFHMKQIDLIAQASEDYALLDSGEGEKLERYGTQTLVRPDPQVLWAKNDVAPWGNADGRFVREGSQGKWLWRTGSLKKWEIAYGGLYFLIHPNAFKHTGLFPEQAPNWDWMRRLITAAPAPVSVLNLFAYTGGATMVAAQAGASVAHVDASKVAVAWARENAVLSGLADKPIRFIVEDALSFVRREIKRGATYDGIIMDPPSFGRGPDGQVWKIEEDFERLVSLCHELLSEKPLFFIANGYASGYASLSFAYNLQLLEEKFGGEVEYGELHIAEAGGRRELPSGIYARWASDAK